MQPGKATLPLILLGILSLFPARNAIPHGEQRSPSKVATRPVPLLKGLFAIDYPITTVSRAAQAYFNQGLVLTYGFDHADAGTSFLEAARLDPDCAMAYWGAAFVLGPNINAPMDDADVPRAYALARKALALAGRATGKERALIKALAARYAPTPVADRSSLDRAFAAAMGEVYQSYADDPNVAVLYAESLMDLHPWDYWNADGSPQPWEPQIEQILTRVIQEHPRHPHGRHLYIHLLENSPHPEVLVKSADIIRTLAPASGHLVHMAGHAYYASGLYHDCSQVNEEAIEVDKTLIAAFDTDGLYRLAYVPHNLHFLLASYMMEGRSREAVVLARTLSAGVDPEQMRRPGLGGLQQFYLTPYYTLARFGFWDEILAEPAPPADLKYPLGMWHYARGLAQVRKGNLAGGEEELAALKGVAADPEAAALKIWELNSGGALLGIAVEVLSGEIAAGKGEKQSALADFERGVVLEEGLVSDEPPPWYYPVRQSLGALLLDLGRNQEAEAVFRRDLLKNAENPWSLLGLAQALRAEGKNDQAADAEQRFRRAWARADLELLRPVF